MVLGGARINPKGPQGPGHGHGEQTPPRLECTLYILYYATRSGIGFLAVLILGLLTLLIFGLLALLILGFLALQGYLAHKKTHPPLGTP